MLLGQSALGVGGKEQPLLMLRKHGDIAPRVLFLHGGPALPAANGAGVFLLVIRMKYNIAGLLVNDQADVGSSYGGSLTLLRGFLLLQRKERKKDGFREEEEEKKNKIF